MLEVAFRRIGPAHLTVVQAGNETDVRVTVDMGRGMRWDGIASFPASMVDEAVERVSRVQTANDLEDLLREFGGYYVWSSFQAFRALTGL